MTALSGLDAHTANRRLHRRHRTAKYPQHHPPIEPWTTSIKPKLQLVWGVLLVLAGVGLHLPHPQVMPQIKQIDYFAAVIPFIYFCMYFVAVFLIAGGARKLYLNTKSAEIRHSRPGRKEPPRRRQAPTGC